MTCCCSPFTPPSSGGGAAPGLSTGGFLTDVPSNTGQFELLDGGASYTYAGNPDFAAGTGLQLVFGGSPRLVLATFALSLNRDTVATYQIEVSIDLNGDIIATTSGFPWVQHAGIFTTTNVGGMAICQRLMSLAPGDVVSACFQVPGGTADGSIHVYNASLAVQ